MMMLTMLMMLTVLTMLMMLMIIYYYFTNVNDTIFQVILVIANSVNVANPLGEGLFVTASKWGYNLPNGGLKPHFGGFIPPFFSIHYRMIRVITASVYGTKVHDKNAYRHQEIRCGPSVRAFQSGVTPRQRIVVLKE